MVWQIFSAILGGENRDPSRACGRPDFFNLSFFPARSSQFLGRLHRSPPISVSGAEDAQLDDIDFKQSYEHELS